jgi:phage terminase large subunit-like protein
MTTISSPARSIDPPPAAIAGLIAPIDPPVAGLFDAEAWAARTAKPGDWFDERAAAHACAFFPRYLRHTKGRWAGRPFDLLPWQRSIIRAAFGWKRADGLRRFRNVFLEVPRKNGKTGLAAGVALYLAFASGEVGAEVYCAATTKEQANITFREASRMRALSPQLRERTDAFKFNLSAAKSFSKLEVLSSDHGNKDGLNTSGLVGDEIHQWRDRDLHDVLTTSTGARDQPMEFYTTTAGLDVESLWTDMHDHAMRVRDGEVDDHELLPVLYGAEEDDDPFDAATWAKANPSWGAILKPEYLEKKAARAKREPSFYNTFLRLHLNIKTKQTTTWLPAAEWKACNIRPVTPDLLAGRRCWGGLDLSSTTDITAFVLVFEPGPDDVIDLLPFFWLPQAGLEARAARDRVPYQAWVERGHIALTDGNVVDYDAIRRRIAGAEGAGGLMHEYQIVDIARDRWNATHLSTQLMGEGLAIVDFGQGFASMSAPCKEFEKRVMNRTINWGGNPVLEWMGRCTDVMQDAAENMKPVKPERKKTGKRIDGIVAAIMGLGRFIGAEHSDEGSLDDYLSNPVMT